MFVDLSRWPSFGLVDTPQYYVVRSTLDTDALLPHVREALRQVDGDGYPEHVLRMEEDVLSSALAAPRMRAILFGVFAALGLTLAAVGVYGVMAYTVARSTRELAVRLAIGARARELLRMVLARAGALTVTGVLLGWAGAAAVTQSLETMLYGLSPLDAPTFVGVGILFLSVALFGAYVPARRAMQVDPLVVLRSE